MGTNSQTMAWMMDAYSQRYGYSPAIVTGKPIELGGSYGREAATGRGVVYCLGEWASLSATPLEAKTIAIQGFGQVGSWAARLIGNLGCTVIAVSDVKGGVYNRQGININELLKHKSERGSVVDFLGAETITNKELLELDCDILIPAAIEAVIHEGNADRVKASVIVEAANYPITPQADKILLERGVTILPDILANAGGVIVSYFEWTQNIQQFRWEEERVNEELSKLMTKATQTVYQAALREGVSLRDAAYLIAVGRVVRAIELRGAD
jgi:glutamate dehydrogenase (NAD(P)+)